MGGACSAQVQAQYKHSRERKTGSALALQAAFADINIHKRISTKADLYIIGSIKQRKQHE
jgi:putative NIF3 family GTP cyclohydrolase 1 type 2